MALRRIALPLILTLACCASQGQTPALSLANTIPLPGVEGRIDHLATDIDGQRVFLAALGNGTIEVVDLRRSQRVGQVKGLNEPQGLLYLPSKNSLYVATGGDGMVRSYDAQSLALLHSIHLGDDADNIRYDHQRDSIMVGYGDGAIAMLPTNLGTKVTEEIRLPAHPESFQVSPNGSELFVNLPHDQSIAQISLVPLTVTAWWTHLGAQSNFPMAIDRNSDHLFVACRLPAQLLSLNTKNGSVAERIPTVGDADDLFFDEQRSRIYVIGGQGFIDVVDAPKSGKLHSIAHITTAAGARTGLFVPGWNKLLVAAPHRGAEPARLLVYDLH